MYFRFTTGVIPPDAHDCAYLIQDNWDDWFQFRTMFTLFVIDAAGDRTRVGSVKIGQMGLRPGRETAPRQRSTALPEEFDALVDEYFSLGQGEDYYQTLNTLNQETRQRVLVGLRDCAFNLAIFNQARDELCMQVSLLRSVPAQSVTGRLHRLSEGNVELTEFRFRYTLLRPQGGVEPPTLDFFVTPESEPPSNVHVLIGRNGAGKTRAMKHLVSALLGRQSDEAPEEDARVSLEPATDGDWSFAGLVMISFSAFDDFELLPDRNDLIPFEQVGLRHRSAVEGIEQGGIKAPRDLAIDFEKSLGRCRAGLRAERWRAAVERLESDDLFAEADVRSLLDLPNDDWSEAARRLFGRLSSGHAVVLLTITRLVELVDEKTLVLLDEPEGHLHPPLLSAFIRALSELLVKRNGVAIVATHSPVVLQEAPRSCVWKLRRSRLVSVAERPAVETFGENVGTLTREVFGLEVTKAGFHNLLDSAVNTRGLNYADVVATFGGQLGAEAKAIVQALIAQRDSGQ
jgi:AAA domain, putative AbiEii toxin, Type IV TA system